MSGKTLIGDTLTTLFYHNLWANLRLIDACALLGEEQLAATDAGAYGTVRSTLEHIVDGEYYYVWLLQNRPSSMQEMDMTGLGLNELRALAQQTGEQLIQLAATVEGTDTVEVQSRGKTRQVPKGVILTQAIHHANEHRTNITTILSREGIEPPEVSAWMYFRTMQE